MSPPRPLQILLVEDSPTDALLARTALDEPSTFAVKHVDRLSRALELSGQQQFDAVLLDLGLPDSMGIESLQRVRAEFSHTAIIVLTALEDEDLVIRTARAGADDYIVKHDLHGGNLKRVIRHVFERNRLLSALKESETRKAAILDSAHSSIVTCGGDGRIVEINRAAAIAFGLEPVSVIGTPFTDIVDLPELRRLFASKNRHVFEGPATLIESIEVNAIRGDGSRMPIELTVAAIACDGLTCFTAYMLDLRRRKHLEAEARLLNEALQTVAQGISISDPNQPDNPIIFVTRGFESLTGYKSSEVLGRNCRFLQGRDTDATAVARMRDAIATAEPYTGELLNYKKDGRSFWNSLQVSPVRDAQGRLTHFVGIQSDVTERRQLEDQLRQSQKMEAVGQLAGGVAHDFNNMLAVILGYTDALLRSQQLTLDEVESLREIQKAGESAAAVTRQLLAFSRRQVVEPEALNLNDVVSDLTKMLTRLLGEDIKLVADLEPALWPIRADRGQLEQVIVNIALNARDAMPEGGRLSIRTRNVSTPANQTAAARRHVELTIADNGAGMDEETQSRIFEPFFTTKPPGEGTGLGLASVYGIVQQAEGEIAVCSELGNGATFAIHLPAIDLPAVAASETIAPVSTRGSETILFVEDEELLRRMLTKGLTAMGYKVLTAKDGEEALALVRAGTQQIHVLVTDLVMPRMSGGKLASHVQAEYPQIKILYVSGYTSDVVVRHEIENSAAFLQKPFSVESLCRKIREILD